jgi:membrane-bound lytic murein transglycosylase B
MITKTLDRTATTTVDIVSVWGFDATGGEVTYAFCGMAAIDSLVSNAFRNPEVTEVTVDSLTQTLAIFKRI